MMKQAWLSFSLAGTNLTQFGMKIPSPYASLQLSNSEIASMTSWQLTCIVGGDDRNKINVAAMEGLLYQAAQQTDLTGTSGVPVAFAFGWLDASGNVSDYISYQGFTLKFTVSTNGQYMTYVISGYASIAIQASEPVLRIPELHGYVQPSAVVEGLAKAVKATSYYDLDIDHNDVPTLVSHGALNTSFNRYVRGELSGNDDYDSFPGLLRLSKSYSMSRSAAGLKYPYRKLSTITNVVGEGNSAVKNYLKGSLTDSTVQCASFSYWIDEPTMTKQGVIHYKSNAGLLGNYNSDTLQIGTANTNILSLQGSYNGVAYNMTDMNFQSLGFTLDTSGQTIINSSEVVNSWSSSLEDVYQSANIVNDINAIASQFSGDFTIQIPGSTSKYTIAQPISLLVVTGNTISPVTGIYNIISVSHSISNTFITTLKVQRLTISTANQVATQQGIYTTGSTPYSNGLSTYSKTSNIISPYKVDFGTIYPTFEHLQQQAV